MGSFPSATICYGIFRHGELSGVAVLGTAQHKNTIPNVFGPAHAKDCLLLQRFALENVLEFNAESYFLARVRTLLKMEGYGGILTLEATKRRKPTFSVTSLFPDISGRFLKVITQFISVTVLSRTSTFSPTEVCCQIVASANWSITNRAGVVWRGNLNFTAQAIVLKLLRTGVSGDSIGADD